MRTNEEQFEKIRHLLPVRRGNVAIDSLAFINAVPRICENGCKWRGLPKEHGHWHVIHKRCNRWVKGGIMEKLFQEARAGGTVEPGLLMRPMDSMTSPVRPDACGAKKKNGGQSIGRSCGGPATKIHVPAASERAAAAIALSAGQCRDAPPDRALLETAGRQKELVPLVMDRAHQDDDTWFVAQMLKFEPVVPPKSNRKDPWEYDKELYKMRNKVERLFRLLQGFRRVFCRYDKLAAMYLGFVQFALVYVSIRQWEHALSA